MKYKHYSWLVILSVLLSCTSSPNSDSSEILQAKYSRPLTDLTYDSTPERLARGKYLIETLRCFNCHSEPDTTKAGWPPLPDRLGAGALRFKTDSTFLYASNITPDPKTGIGNFTDDMIGRAIREYIGFDGRSLAGQAFNGKTGNDYRNLSDEDLASIVVYLKSIPPIINEIPERNLGIKGEMRTVGNGNPLTKSLEPPDSLDMLSQGKYLISLSHCKNCHTAFQKRNPGNYGGGRPFNVYGKRSYSSNISSDITGMGGWSAEIFIDVIRTGKRGTLSPEMPWVAFRNFTDEDLTAIYHALMTTPQVKHHIVNGIPPTYCEICEFEHGLGEMNKIEPLTYLQDFPVPKELEGVYINSLNERDTARITVTDSILIYSQYNREWKLSQIEDGVFFALNFRAPIHFIKDEQGNISDMKFKDLERYTYKKLESHNKH
ncbi:MAG: hypothetical protein R3345_01155 [Fulvivirga sp.]|nr:hypothetical protein [Fulvivirga sp.]